MFFRQECDRALRFVFLCSPFWHLFFVSLCFHFHSFAKMLLPREKVSKFLHAVEHDAWAHPSEAHTCLLNHSTSTSKHVIDEGIRINHKNWGCQQ